MSLEASCSLNADGRLKARLGGGNLYYSCKTSTLGLKLIQALSDAEWKQAILHFSKTGNHNLTEAFKDNVVLDYAGVRYPNCRTGIGSR